MNETKHDINLLLIGKTGNGKSATGNSILNRKVFKSAASTTSVTKNVQIHFSNYSGRTIMVVDGPGVGDTDLSDDVAKKQIIETLAMAIAASPEGYHAFLLVVRFGRRFTKEDLQTINFLKTVFGESFVKNFSVLVVTCGDNFNSEDTECDSFEEWCSCQAGVFQDVISECGNRVVLFDNKTKDDNVINRQRKRLLDAVDGLNNGGKRYTDKHFQEASRIRDKLLRESKFPLIREKSMKEASLIIQEILNIQLSEPTVQLLLLHDLNARANNLVHTVMQGGHKSCDLKEIIQIAKHVKDIVENQIKQTNVAIQIQEQRHKVKEEEVKIRQEKAKLEWERQEYEKEDLQEIIRKLENEEGKNQKKLQTMQETWKHDIERVEREYVDVSSCHSGLDIVFEVRAKLLEEFLCRSLVSLGR